MPGVTLRHVLVHENELVRGSLDFQGRSCHSAALSTAFHHSGYVLVVTASAKSAGEVVRRQVGPKKCDVDAVLVQVELNSVGFGASFHSLKGFSEALGPSSLSHFEAELTDEQLVALWRGAVEVLEKHGGFDARR